MVRCTKMNGSHTLHRRIDSIEVDFWVRLVLMLVLPCAILAFGYAVLEELFGGAAMLLIGSTALYLALDE